MSDSNHVATYPSDRQLQRWETECEKGGFRSRSEFVEAMVEAGLKKFDISEIQPDETNRELRKQRNELRSELDRARERINELEDAVYQGEHQAIVEYVQENPGAGYDEIIQELVETVPDRVTRHLDDLEGDALEVKEDGYYYRGNSSADGRWS